MSCKWELQVSCDVRMNGGAGRFQVFGSWVQDLVMPLGVASQLWCQEERRRRAVQVFVSWVQALGDEKQITFSD